MTTMITPAELADIKTEVDRMIKERRVGSARFDRTRWAYLMDQLHAEALAEYAAGTWCVVCLQTNVTPRHQVPAGTKLCRGSNGQEYGIRTRVVTPCAQTCTTEKCYYEPEGRPDCPLC